MTIVSHTAVDWSSDLSKDKAESWKACARTSISTSPDRSNSPSTSNVPTGVPDGKKDGICVGELLGTAVGVTGVAEFGSGVAGFAGVAGLAGRVGVSGDDPFVDEEAEVELVMGVLVEDALVLDALVLGISTLVTSELDVPVGDVAVEFGSEFEPSVLAIFSVDRSVEVGFEFE